MTFLDVFNGGSGAFTLNMLNHINDKLSTDLNIRYLGLPAYQFGAARYNRAYRRSDDLAGFDLRL